jgi:hypothetical protein
MRGLFLTAPLNTTADLGDLGHGGRNVANLLGESQTLAGPRRTTGMGRPTLTPPTNDEVVDAEG